MLHASVFTLSFYMYLINTMVYVRLTHNYDYVYINICKNTTLTITMLIVCLNVIVCRYIDHIY